MTMSMDANNDNVHVRMGECYAWNTVTNVTLNLAGSLTCIQQTKVEHGHYFVYCFSCPPVFQISMRYLNLQNYSTPMLFFQHPPLFA